MYLKEYGAPYSVSKGVYKHISLTELGCRVHLALELGLPPELPPSRNFLLPLSFSVPVVIVKQDVWKEEGRTERDRDREKTRSVQTTLQLPIWVKVSCG